MFRESSWSTVRARKWCCMEIPRKCLVRRQQPITRLWWAFGQGPESWVTKAFALPMVCGTERSSLRARACSCSGRQPSRLIWGTSCSASAKLSGEICFFGRLRSDAQLTTFLEPLGGRIFTSLAAGSSCGNFGFASNLFAARSTNWSPIFHSGCRLPSSTRTTQALCHWASSGSCSVCPTRGAWSSHCCRFDSKAALSV